MQNNAGQRSTPGRLTFAEKMNGVFYLFVALIPISIGYAVYYGHERYIVKSKPVVSGVITDVSLDQGENHITKATVSFPSSDAPDGICIVHTWFRRSDRGITPDAAIRVVPAATCSEPWFPDHIPTVDEPLEVAALCAGVAFALYWIKQGV